MKKKFMIACALVLSLVLVSDNTFSSLKPAVTANENLHVTEYKNEIEKILMEIGEAAILLQKRDMGDLDNAIKITREVSRKITPLYKKLSNLNAPDSLKKSHAKIKEGSEAGIEILEVSLEFFELKFNPNVTYSGDRAKKIQEIENEIVILNKKSLKLQEGLIEVYAAYNNIKN